MKTYWFFLVLWIGSMAPCFGQRYQPYNIDSLFPNHQEPYSFIGGGSDYRPFSPKKKLIMQKQAAENDTIWRIRMTLTWANPDLHGHSGAEFICGSPSYHEYTPDGTFIRFSYTYIDTDGSSDSIVRVFNRTHFREGKDIPDTVIYYGLNNNVYEPYYRLIYSYHLYDSLMYSMRDEYWIGGKWVESARVHQYYYDTISWFKNKKENYQNGKLIYGLIYTPEHDNKGNVISVTEQVCEGYNMPYYYRLRREYEYDEAGVCRAYNGWMFENGTFVLRNRVFDIEWYDWQGFGDGIPLVFRYIGLGYPDDYYSKMSYSQSVVYDDNGTATPYSARKTYWNVDGNNGIVDSLFHYYESVGRFCLVSTTFRSFDEYGAYKDYGYADWTAPDENGIQEIIQKNTRTNFVETTYHPRFTGLEQKVDHYVSEYADGVWDTDLHSILIVQEYIATNYNYVSVPELPLPLPAIQPLSIAPNPVSGVATIAAATEIKQLQIFDITGKLMKEQVVSADKAVFDTGNLPKGIYIVQALLKNGERQMGKLVVP